ELINNTVITLVASFVLAIFIFGADRLISRILEFIYPG
ncbi:MAG: preprotein translocase subunit SecE, partial [Rhodothermaceae bacterium]|nr:preprotein translocase subunit SecE [Rhodothermaceae bacterium]